MRIGERAGLTSGRPMRDIFGEALLAVCTENPQVVVLDGDLGNSTKAETVRKAFPERFFNIGIAESNLVGIGAGLAGAGYIPWITSFSSFLLCNAYDQLRLAVAISNLNAKILGSHGGITLGKDGPTQMGIEDFALVGGLPTVQMLVPSDETAMLRLVKVATDHPGPVWLRSSRLPMPNIYTDTTEFKIGGSHEVRTGNDLAIIACGLMVGSALDAAAMLAEEGVEARVIDLYSLRPMDTEAIVRAARETGAIVTAEEHLLTGGMGSNVARIVASHFPVPMQFIGLPDLYVESADPYDLLEKYHLTPQDIYAAARQVLKAKESAIYARG
jgi:transketolase